MSIPEGYTAPDPDVRTIYAYCWRSGEVAYGAYIPDGAIELWRGGLREVLYVGKRLLEPSEVGLIALGIADPATDESALPEVINQYRLAASHYLGRDAQQTNFGEREVTHGN